MFDLLFGLLFGITDFIMSLIPDLPDFTPYMSGNSAFYSIFQMIGFWTNHNALIGTLIALSFSALIIYVITKAIRFVINLIPGFSA